MPSIAQLEERGTVKETLLNPKVTGSTPVRRILLLQNSSDFCHSHGGNCLAFWEQWVIV